VTQEAFAASAPGFTTVHVEAGLPAVSIIADGSETFMAFLARLASLFGGYCYVEDLDAHLFLTETSATPDDIDHTPGRLLDDPPIKIRSDDSQQRTRVYGKGYGEHLLADVAAGESILPIPDVAMFNVLGGQVIAGTTPDGAQSEILGYTSVRVGGAGASVGPGVAPSTMPVLTLVTGSGVTSGVHGYACVWVTATGKSFPSPIAPIVVGPLTGVSNPTVVGTGGVQARNVIDYVDNTLTAGATYDYKLTHRRVSDGAETLPTAAVGGAIPNAGDNIIYFQKSLMHAGAVPPSGCVVVWYRSKNGGAYQECTAVDNTASYYVDNTADANVGQAIPTVNNTTGGNQVTYSRIAGPPGTTGREYYRTVAVGSLAEAWTSQLKLLATLSDNTTVTPGTDNTADGALGANAPTSDTSGLIEQPGQVNAGSASLLTSGAPPFTSGWVVLGGGQLVRFNGVTGNTLTGIPAIGAGAILTTVPYGSLVIFASALVGVTGNTLAMLKGTPVHLWVERNDLAAQAELVALDAAQGRVSDGVVEHMIIDMRRGEASLIALCDADLQRYSRPLLTVTFDARDTKLKSGKPITFNLTSPAIAATLTLMSVDISEIDVIPAGLAPRFHCVASSTAVSLESILRKLLTKAA